MHVFLNPNEFLRSMYIIKRKLIAIDVVQMKSHLDGDALLISFNSSRRRNRGIFLGGEKKKKFRAARRFQPPRALTFVYAFFPDVEASILFRAISNVNEVFVYFVFDEEDEEQNS